MRVRVYVCVCVRVYVCMYVCVCSMTVIMTVVEPSCVVAVNVHDRYTSATARLARCSCGQKPGKSCVPMSMLARVVSASTIVRVSRPPQRASVSSVCR